MDRRRDFLQSAGLRGKRVATRLCRAAAPGADLTSWKVGWPRVRWRCAEYELRASLDPLADGFDIASELLAPRGASHVSLHLGGGHAFLRLRRIPLGGPEELGGRARTTNQGTQLIDLLEPRSHRATQLRQGRVAVWRRLVEASDEG